MTSKLINYPPITMLQVKPANLLSHAFEPLHSSLPCDLHLVNLRSLGSDLDLEKTKFLLILHRLGYDCDFKDHFYDCEAVTGKVNHFRYTDWYIFYFIFFFSPFTRQGKQLPFTIWTVYHQEVSLLHNSKDWTFCQTRETITIRKF